METQSPIPREFQLAQQLQALARDAAQALLRAARLELSTLFSRFLKRAPEALIDTSRTLLGDAEQRHLQDLARTLQTHAARWSELFIGAVEAQWTSGPGDADLESDKRVAAADEAIAMANIEMRADALYRQPLAELNAQLTHLRQTLYLPLHLEALAPAALYRALQNTADALSWPATRRRVLVTAFDQSVVAGLQRVYQALYRVLEHYQQESQRIGAEPVEAPPPAPVALSATAATDPSRDAPLHLPKVDSTTLSMLMAQAAHSSTVGYNDGALAADLLALASNEPLADVPQEQAWVPLQRMELAGNFLNESISDPLIPEALRPQHESVRFPLVKSALSDSTFFTAVTHPLRSLVNELLLKSATSHITGNSETRRMAELLQQVLVQFDLAPDFVRQAMLNAEPIPPAQVEQFLAMQRQQSQQRREAVIGEAKRRAIRELELSSFGRDLPPIMLRFLNVAWGPLLVRRLLAGGVAHPSWKAGLATLDAMIDQVEARDPSQPASAEWRELLQKVRRDLGDSGLTPDRVSGALEMLEAARTAKKTIDLRTAVPRVRE